MEHEIRYETREATRRSQYTHRAVCACGCYRSNWSFQWKAEEMGAKHLERVSAGVW